MGDKGKKDKGKQEEQKKGKQTLKEKRKKKKDKMKSVWENGRKYNFSGNFMGGYTIPRIRLQVPLL
jgi:hypothetical protein